MEINKISYTDFISLIREENRPPGGKKTVREFLLNSFTNQKSKVLEVGCTNGFTTLEIARTIGCKTYGIDINKKSLKNAQQRVKNERASFLFGSAYNIPFRSNKFDLVVCSNATSFMDNKKKAISEYKRVVKPWGFVAISPMYYIKTPPREIVAEVSKIIGSEISIKTKNEWLELFREEGFEIYYIRDYRFNKKTKEDIINYVKKSLNKPHLNILPKEIQNEIKDRWIQTMGVFSENLEHVGYSTILLRKRGEIEEVELFDSREAHVNNKR